MAALTFGNGNGNVNIIQGNKGYAIKYFNDNAPSVLSDPVLIVAASP